MGSMRLRWARLTLMAALCLAFMLAFPMMAWADGAFFGGASEPSQEAVILFRGSTEELTLRVAYQGAEGDFAWVVPLPSEPVIEEAGAGVFDYLYWNYGSLAAAKRILAAGEGSQALGSGVEVVEERHVGIYDTTVLRASDPGGLAAWLGEHGYPYSVEQAELFRHYTDRGWCFVAFRVSPEAATMPRPDLAGPDTAYLQPLRFTFPTPQVVFPLRLSSGNPTGSLVRVYVLGGATFDCEMTPGRVTYALSPGEMEGLKGYLPSLGTAAAGGAEAYLTVFEHAFSREEMADDLVFTPDGTPVAQPGGLPFMVLAQDASAGSPRRPGRFEVLLALAILMLSLAAIPILLRNRTGSNAWRLFTGLCATFVTMAVVATLAMAILYREDQEQGGSSGWKDLSAGQPAVYTRSEVVPGVTVPGEEGASLQLYAGRIMQDGAVEEGSAMTMGLISYGAYKLSPDGRHVAVEQDGSLKILVLGDDGSAGVIHDTGREMYDFSVEYAAWSPDGERLAVIVPGNGPEGRRQALMVYDTEGNFREMKSGGPGQPAVSWSEDGGYLVSTRIVGSETGEATSAIDIIDPESGSTVKTIVLPARNEKSSFPSGCWLAGDRLVVLRGLALGNQEQGNTGIELALYDIVTGEELEIVKLRQPLSPLMIRTVGEGELALLGLGRSEETGGPVLKDYTFEVEGLKVSEKVERSLGRGPGAADLLDAVAVPGLAMQQASLDESGRYLLVGATGKRTFLVDLLEGDVSVISGMDVGWQVAR